MGFGKVNVGGGLKIKSVQPLFSDIASGASQRNVTIDAVDMDKSFVLVMEEPMGVSVSTGNLNIMGYLTTQTNVNFSRGLSTGGAQNYRAYVVELSGSVKVQRGVISDNDGSAQVAIDAVDQSKAFIIESNKATNAGGNSRSVPISNRFATDTLALFSWDNAGVEAGYTRTIAFYVVEG